MSNDYEAMFKMKQQDWIDACGDIDKLKDERDKLLANLKDALECLKDQVPNLKRIENEIEVCRKQYNMGNYPTIGIGYINYIEHTLERIRANLPELK